MGGSLHQRWMTESSFRLGGHGGLQGGRLLPFLDPGIQQGVAHRQHHGVDEETDDPQCQQAADDPHQNEDQRQVGATLDQEGAQEVVHGAVPWYLAQIPVMPISSSWT